MKTITIEETELRKVLEIVFKGNETLTDDVIALIKNMSENSKRKEQLVKDA